MYTDRAITCADCGQEFTFTAGEQEFYEQRGFTEPPKRCAACRAIRKAQRQSPGYGNGAGLGSASAGYGNGGYGNGGYGGGASYGDSYGMGGGYRERREREMFDAVCANCGNTARVPFRPSGARPVYCSDCFQSRR